MRNERKSGCRDSGAQVVRGTEQQRRDRGRVNRPQAGSQTQDQPDREREQPHGGESSVPAE